jgi:hypothetical protein
MPAQDGETSSETVKRIEVDLQVSRRRLTNVGRTA